LSSYFSTLSQVPQSISWVTWTSALALSNFPSANIISNFNGLRSLPSNPGAAPCQPSRPPPTRRPPLTGSTEAHTSYYGEEGRFLQLCRGYRGGTGAAVPYPSTSSGRVMLYQRGLDAWNRSRYSAPSEPERPGLNRLRPAGFDIVQHEQDALAYDHRLFGSIHPSGERTTVGAGSRPRPWRGCARLEDRRTV